MIAAGARTVLIAVSRGKVYSGSGPRLNSRRRERSESIAAVIRGLARKCREELWSCVC